MRRASRGKRAVESSAVDYSLVAPRRFAGWLPVVGAWAVVAGLSLALRPLLPVDEVVKLYKRARR